jgi:hypothetical protein
VLTKRNDTRWERRDLRWRAAGRIDAGGAFPPAGSGTRVRDRQRGFDAAAAGSRSVRLSSAAYFGAGAGAGAPVPQTVDQRRSPAGAGCC